MSINREVSRLYETVKNGQINEMMRMAADFVDILRPEIVGRTQMVLNVGENYPNAYFLHLPEFDSIFYLNPLIGSVFITIAGIEVANGLRNGNLEDLSCEHSSAKYQVMSVTARAILKEMVDSVQEAHFESPMQSLNRLHPHHYPKLQELLLANRVTCKPGTHRQIEPGREKGYLETDERMGWVFVSYHWKTRLSKIVAVDSPVVVTNPLGGGLDLRAAGERHFHLTDVFLDSLGKEPVDYNAWRVSRVWGHESRKRRNDFPILGTTGDTYEAFPCSLSVIAKLQSFEQPSFPWTWPEK